MYYSHSINNKTNYRRGVLKITSTYGETHYHIQTEYHDILPIIL